MEGEMVMLSYYKILKQVFEKVRFWEMEPMNDLVPYGNLCLANPGKQYLVYNQIQAARVSLSKGEKYQVWMIDPFTGKTSRLPDAETNDGSWQYPGFLKDPFVFLLERIQ
jgi:outer membrane lipoprotein-sorting protein